MFYRYFVITALTVAADLFFAGCEVGGSGLRNPVIVVSLGKGLARIRRLE